MIREFRALFERVRERPGMWLVDDTYATHVTFAMGVHEGTGRTLLTGFREFLLVKIGRESSLAYPSLVMWLVEPVGPQQTARPHGRGAGRRHRPLVRAARRVPDHPSGPERMAQIYGEYLGMLKRSGLSFGHHGTERLGLALRAISEPAGRTPTGQDLDYSRNNLDDRDHREG